MEGLAREEVRLLLTPHKVGINFDGEHSTSVEQSASETRYSRSVVHCSSSGPSSWLLFLLPVSHCYLELGAKMLAQCC